jgi:hypothetical protein
MRSRPSFRSIVSSRSPLCGALVGTTLLTLSAWPLASCDDDGTGGTAGTGAAGGSGGTTSTGGTTHSCSGSGTGCMGGVGAYGGYGAAGGTGGQGGSVHGWAADPPVLNNDAACQWPQTLAPNPGEAGHLYAARLTPPSYPFEITEIHYELVGDDPCDSSPAHRVEIFVDTAVAPAASPSVTQLDIPAAGATEPVRVVKEILPSPITLQSGEHLFVAVELVNQGSSCLAVCEGAAAWDRDYWSNATGAPYAWQALSDYGLYIHGRIGANGTAQ